MEIVGIYSFKGGQSFIEEHYPHLLPEIYEAVQSIDAASHKLKVSKEKTMPVKEFADEMSTGVSYFEQFVWDLQHRGEADIDVPVLILGIK